MITRGCVARVAACLCAAGGAAAAIAAPNQFETDATGMLAIGKRIEADDPMASEQIYHVLENDANIDIRAEARFRMARLAMARGEWRTAAVLLRRVLDDRPEAAAVRLTLASVLVEIGDEGAALRELRAAQAGGLPIDVARMVDRFSVALRARRPFGASLEMALAPDSNVNAATARDTLGTVIGDFEIDPGAKRRSGVGVTVRGATFARFSVDQRMSVLARAAVGGDFYRNRQFNNLALEVGVGPELKLGPLRLNLEAATSRRWYGGNVFEDRVKLDANGSIPLGPRMIGRARVGMATVDNHLNNLQDGRLLNVEFAAERALGGRAGIALSVAGERLSARDPGYSTKAWRGQVVGWREFGRTTAHATVSVGGLKAHERLALFPEPRHDRSSYIGVGATMRQFEVDGFAPLVRFSIERTKSNVAFYDHVRKRAEFGIVRAF